MLFPDDLKYSKEHEWIKISGDTGVVGITQFAQDKLGDIVFVELPDVGSEYKQADEFGVVESVKTVSNLYMPVSGKVTAVNKDLVGTPELINDEPYGKGWIIKIKVKNPAEAEKLLEAREYQELVED